MACAGLGHRVRAQIHIQLRRGSDGSIGARGNLATPPYWCRWDGSTLWIVGSAACPVGDDQISFTLDVGPGLDVTVRNVAATIVYAASGSGTSIDTHLVVAEGAVVRWLPEPVIVTARALHRSSMEVTTTHDAVVCVDELTVMGRGAETCGAIRTSVRANVDGVPRLRSSFDSSLPGWDGPGGTGGARVHATRLFLEPDLGSATDRVPLEPTPPLQVDRPPQRTALEPRAALLLPEGGGRLALALADDPDMARAALDELVSVPPVAVAAATTIPAGDRHGATLI